MVGCILVLGLSVIGRVEKKKEMEMRYGGVVRQIHLDRKLIFVEW